MREGAGLRRHHQHDAADQPSADAAALARVGGDDDGRQERGAAAAGGAEPAVDSIWRPAPAPISTASRRRSTAAPPLTSASPHVKLGELIGLAARDADARSAALAERPRSELHARRLPRARALRRDARRRSSTTSRRSRCDADLELLRKNSKAALYEPLVGAAAHALAAVLDRVRHGTLPASVAARCDGAAGGAAGRESRGAARPLAGVPRAAAAARARRSEDARARRDRARLVREVARAA